MEMNAPSLGVPINSMDSTHGLCHPRLNQSWLTLQSPWVCPLGVDLGQLGTILANEIGILETE